MHSDHRIILVEGAHRGIDHEHHSVGHRDGQLSLFRDLLRHAPGIRDPATGVHQHELATIPVRVVGDTVTRHAGDILHHGLSATDDAVHQC